MSETRESYTIRMSPCSVYDVIGMERWLEEMAQQGLMLENYIMGFAVFKKQQPKTVRYQLALLPYEPLMEQNPTAQAEMIAICEAYGWHYVTKRDRFGIFVTEDEAAQPLYSDPQLEADEYKELQRYERSAFRSNLLWLIVIMPMSFFSEYLLHDLLLAGTLFYLFFFLVAIWFVVNNTKNILQLRKLEKHLETEGTLRNCQIPQHPTSYRIYKMVPVIGAILCIFFLVSNSAAPEELPLYRYTKPLPFARLEEVVIGGEKIIAGDNDTICVERDLLAPTMMTVSQSGHFHMSDDNVEQFSMYVNYYEMVHPQLALRLAEELHAQDQEWAKKRYQQYTLSELDVDYAIAYEAFSTNLILVKEHQVLSVSFDDYESGAVPLEQWSNVFADSLNE